MLCWKWVFVATLSLGMASAEPAFAQRQGGFLSGLFGNNQNNRAQQAANSAQRRANRGVQSALNFFGFDAGGLDGILGRKSRTAISDFQTFIGYEATGNLTREERRFLLSAFNEINVDDEALALKISLGLISVQDLLKARAEGGAETPEILDEAAPDAPLSMRSLCINIGANGPLDLVKAQFCNLRQLAIEQSDFLLETSLTTTSIAPVISECQSFTTEIQPQIALVATEPAAVLLSNMDLWFRRSGASKDKLFRQAQTCLGVAYRHDDPEAALASLLVLSGLKDPIFIELSGYHIAFGLGLNEARDMGRAQGWMEASIAAQTDENVSLTSQSSQQRIDTLVDIITILSAQE
ncbi:MAG TPA: peptidoglycan-binding protein [Rhodobacteraceae bacterium]|nr:peptidoglycan-binding protein [Paracoccaceae bacterium]